MLTAAFIVLAALLVIAFVRGAALVSNDVQADEQAGQC